MRREEKSFTSIFFSIIALFDGWSCYEIIYHAIKPTFYDYNYYLRYKNGWTDYVTFWLNFEIKYLKAYVYHF